VRANEWQAACRNKRRSRRARSASGLTPFVSEGKRGFSPERGERPAGHLNAKLGRTAMPKPWDNARTFD
jgi:hypothetical protein